MKRPKWLPGWVNETFVMVILPGVLVGLLIAGFMIYGFQKPGWTMVDTVDILIDDQQDITKELIEISVAGDHSVTDPYFTLDPYDISPLSGLLIFSTEDLTSFFIEVEGKTEDATLLYQSDVASTHYIPVVGLYANTTNTVRIYNEDNGVMGELVTTLSIPTTTLEDGVETPSELTTTYDYFGDDWMVLTASNDTLPVAIDAFGDVRWYLSSPLGSTLEPLQNGNFIIGSDRMISSPYYSDSLWEINLLGKIISQYYIPGGYHHDVVEMPNENLLVLSNDFDHRVEDIIIEIDRTTGLIVDSWDIAEMVNPNMGQNLLWSEMDWFHANSIDYDSATDRVLVSGRNQDIVVNFNKNTKDVNYIIGDPETWASDEVEEFFLTPVGTAFEWPYAQRSATFLPNGDIYLFDNGNNRAKTEIDAISASDNYSRGVIYHIDETSREISQVFSFGEQYNNGFYSPYNSNVGYYAENHYVVHSGGIALSIEGSLNTPPELYLGDDEVTRSSRTVEVLNDTIVYDLVMPNHYNQAYRIQPFEHTSYQSHLMKSYGEQMATPQYLKTIDRRWTILQTLPPIYNLSLTKEYDRLVVQGVFNSNDRVFVELQQNEESNYYMIATKQDADSPQCTVIYENDQSTIISYVNERDIQGRFDVFLIINGHRYNTYQQVTFN